MRPASDEVRWGVVLATTVAFGIPIAFALSPRTALYWYAFPLFGIGVCYVVQFRRQFSWRWLATFAGAAIVSPVALALDWPFSGHVLWNVLFIGHANATGKRRRAWMGLLGASLAELLVLKAAFQTRRDLVGGGISIAIALGLLAALRGSTPRRDTPTPA